MATVSNEINFEKLIEPLVTNKPFENLFSKLNDDILKN